MALYDRRGSERRTVAPSSTAGLGAFIAEERREKSDRRRHPRRRTDMRTIAHYAHAIEAGETRLEVIVDGADGMRLVAMFQCGCVAIEPIGAGATSLRTEPCSAHAPVPVSVDRRRGPRHT
jgi:hypothetical protein